MIVICIITLMSVYFLGLMMSPFPCWNSYFKLWKNVLLNPMPVFPFLLRVNYAVILVQYAIKSSIFGYLWQLDRLIYRNYLLQEVTPTFIIGEPRSGTTFLHRSMGVDDANFFAIRHIEWRYPFISVQKLIRLFGLEEWIGATNYWPNNAYGAEAKKMHQNTLLDFEEDGVFFEECFIFHFFTLLRFPYANLLKHLDDFEGLPLRQQQHLMQTHYEVIQKISFLRGSNKMYLSKETTGHTKLKYIRSMYPHAKFIINLRTSDQFINSLLLLIQVSVLCKTDLDIYARNAQFKSLLVERMRKDCRILLDFLDSDNHGTKQLDASRYICLEFSQLMDNAIESIQYLYRKLNLKITPTFLGRLQEIQQLQSCRNRQYEYGSELFDGFECFDQLVRHYSNKAIYLDDSQ